MVDTSKYWSNDSIIRAAFDEPNLAFRSSIVGSLTATVEFPSEQNVFLVGADSDVQLGTTIPDPINCNIESVESGVDIDVNILTDPVNVNLVDADTDAVVFVDVITSPVSILGSVSIIAPIGITNTSFGSQIEGVDSGVEFDVNILTDPVNVNIAGHDSGVTLDVDIASSIELDVNVQNSELDVNVANEDLLVKAAHPVLSYGQEFVDNSLTLVVSADTRKHGVMVRNVGDYDAWIGFDSDLSTDGSLNAGFLIRPLDILIFPTDDDILAMTEESDGTTLAWTEI